ncbi:MAG TPA: hypothetical protein VFP97_02980 [Chitinophagaceae bacterium]|nr:hypothetical protein [Chitinophagaceae bacterium]
MSATMGNAEIILKSKDVDRLLIGPHSLFYGKRMLTTDAEEFIIEEAEKYSSRTTIYLKVYLPPDNLNRSQVVDSAIRQHFAYRKTRSLKQLSRTLKLGWKGLLIAIIFLSVLVLFTLIIIRQIPEGSLSVIFREVLIILGWVALWRPADLLLYEWRQFKRDANLFERLEHCKIEVITEEM